MIVKSVGVWSVGRMYGTLSAVMGLLFGSFLAIFSVVGTGLAGRNDDMPAFFGLLFGAGAVVVLPIFYGVLGLLMGALGATLYNLFAGLVGGVELDLQ
jgi:Transmembrane domain of unknown function (DUF3566)